MKTSSQFHWRSFALRCTCIVSLFLLFVVANQGVSYAQGCMPNPCAFGYLCGTTTFPVPNISCPTPPSNLTVTVTYCYPDPTGPIFPRTQVEIQTVNVQPACVLTAAAMDMVKEKLVEAIASCSQTVECSEWCDEHEDCFCPSAYAEWTVNATACMKFKTDGSTGYDYFPCGVGTCVSLYQVCCRNGNPDAKWLGTQADAGNCLGQQDCVPLCNTATAGLDCCDENGDPIECEP